MAKRFIDTDIFKKQFIRSLSKDMKLFFFYILTDCNHAGIWECDWDVLNIRTGCNLTKDEVKDSLGDKVVFFDNDNKIFIPSFLEFQYGNELAKSNNIYKGIEKLLIKYDLFDYLTVEIVEETSNSSTIRHRISHKKRAEIYYKNNLTCEYCQEQKKVEELVIDHFIPINKGGDNSDENLICSCQRCNSYKSDIDINDFLSRNHSFLNPTNKILEGASKLLKGAKDKDKEKDKEMDKVKFKEQKENFFKSELIKFKGTYPDEMLNSFFAYWSEWNKSGTKMRYENETTWELPKRLARWHSKR